MALNFPNSPTLNQIYTDSTSGFSYQWNGAVWISFSASTTNNISELDNISGSFNNSTTIFPLTVGGQSVSPASTNQLLISVGGVMQNPTDDYSVSGSNIVFTTAPTNGLTFFGTLLGTALPLNTIADGSVTPVKLSTGGPLWNTSGGVYISGIVTATSFFGNGSGLTGAGSTVFIDTTTNQEFFPLFTSTTSGTITASGISTSKLTYNPSSGAMTAVDFNSTSDISLKENIHTVGNALEITEQLRGVSFDWKETGRSSYGVIAQELEEVLPELVGDGTVKSVNYNGIIGVLIEAIKELKKEIEDLKNTK
jgi:hypothetical protein